MRIANYEDVCEEYADPKHLVEADEGLKKVKWIVYKYTKPINRDMQELYCLDEETFKEHLQRM